MAPELKPVGPKTPRWEPTSDPNDIIVPGLDTTAPPYDQIEQIEQLITIKLQNIDANFSKIQHVMATRVLPAVKRYAVGTQPVREAAKFWTTFYEQAAQIRIPTYDDYSAGQEQEEGQTETTHTESEADRAESSTNISDSESEADTPHANRTYNSDRTTSEVSFAPGQAAVSSTPATVSRTRSQKTHDSFASEATPSWNASLESPLMQLNRDIQILSEDRSGAVPSTSAVGRFKTYDASQDITQRAIPPDVTRKDSSDQGKAHEGPQPLLHNVLRRNANSSTVTTAASTSRTTSPLKFKPKTPVLKASNPYLPPDSKPSEWRGVVDLKDPSVASPQRSMPGSSMRLSAFRPTATMGYMRQRTKTPPPGDDDSFDENFGMSPPVMTDYARLPKLGRTPRQEAASRIMRDLVDVEQRFASRPPGSSFKLTAGTGQAKGTGTGYGTESSMSSMPTPPSMTRYTRSSYAPPAASETSGSVVDASLDSIMRRVGLSVPGYSGKQAAPAPALAPVSELSSRPPVFTSISTSTATSASVFSASASSAASLRSTASSSRTLHPLAAPQPEPLIKTPEPPQYFYDDEVIGRGPSGDVDDSMDSLDYEDQNAADAPAEFLFTAQEDNFDDEDSFDSSMGDDDGTGESGAPFIVPPSDGDGFDDDDSFDDAVYGEGEEETVFGVPPAQRLRQQVQTAGQLRMLGEDLLQDTIGIGTQIALAGRVEESPTPWNNERGGV